MALLIPCPQIDAGYDSFDRPHRGAERERIFGHQYGGHALGSRLPGLLQLDDARSTNCLPAGAELSTYCRRGAQEHRYHGSQERRPEVMNIPSA